MDANKILLIEEIKKMPKNYLEGRLTGNSQILYLYDNVVRLNAKTIVELGTGHGDSTLGLCFGAKSTGGHLFSIDVGSIWYDADIKTKFSSIMDLSQSVSFIVDDDIHFLENFDQKIDLCFIDTSHAYAETFKEIETAFPLLSENGEIFLHDVLHRAHFLDINAAILRFLSKNFAEFHLAYEVIPIDSNGVGRIYKYKFEEETIRSWKPTINPTDSWNMETHWNPQTVGAQYKDKVVLDLGAADGDSAEYYLYENAKYVVAVEGDEKTFEKLLENSHRFNGKIIPIFMFIENSEQIEKLIIDYKPDILKSDIEGAEKYLYEIKDDIWKLVPEYLVETHEVWGAVKTEVLRQKCRQTNYKIVKESNVYAEIIYASRC